MISRGARGKRVLGVLDGAQAAADLHRNADRRADPLDGREIFARAERAVEIDHVQAPCALRQRTPSRARPDRRRTRPRSSGIALLACARIFRRAGRSPARRASLRLVSSSAAVRVALFDRHVRTRGGPVVGRLRPDQAIVGELLEDVRRPAGDASAREETGELVARDAQDRPAPAPCRNRRWRRWCCRVSSLAGLCGWPLRAVRGFVPALSPTVPRASLPSLRDGAARGSRTLYSRWPMPMMRSLRASASRTYGSAFSGAVFTSSARNAAVAAPPCRSPWSVASAAVTEA